MKSEANKSATNKSKTAKVEGEAKHISFKTLSRNKQPLENPEAKQLNNITSDKLCKWTLVQVSIQNFANGQSCDIYVIPHTTYIPYMNIHFG